MDKVDLAQKAEDLATDIVRAIHYSIDWEKWGSKRLRYWSSLQANIEMAATTCNSFKIFLDQVAKHMQIDSFANDLRSARLIARVGKELEDNPDLEQELLRVLREEAQYPVVVVRVEREEGRNG